jgi:hypothetical protein
VDVTESVQGNVLRSAGGGANGFAGELTDVMTFHDSATPDGGSCEPVGSGLDGGPQCGVPCELRWQVTASP